jgi:hypothetical protein
VQDAAWLDNRLRLRALCASKSRLASGSGCGWWVGENATSELEISASSGWLHGSRLERTRTLEPHRIGSNSRPQNSERPGRNQVSQFRDRGAVPAHPADKVELLEGVGRRQGSWPATGDGGGEVLRAGKLPAAWAVGSVARFWRNSSS